MSNELDDNGLPLDQMHYQRPKPRFTPEQAARIVELETELKALAEMFETSHWATIKKFAEQQCEIRLEQAGNERDPIAQAKYLGGVMAFRDIVKYPEFRAKFIQQELEVLKNSTGM